MSAEAGQAFFVMFCLTAVIFFALGWFMGKDAERTDRDERRVREKLFGLDEEDKL